MSSKNRKLKWSEHIASISSSASKTELGLIRRNLGNPPLHPDDATVLFLDYDVLFLMMSVTVLL